MCVCPLGEGNLHPHRAVLNREQPAHANTEVQEERNATALQIPDRRAVRWDQNIEGEEESKKKEHKSPSKCVSDEEKRRRQRHGEGNEGVFSDQKDHQTV